MNSSMKTYLIINRAEILLIKKKSLVGNLTNKNYFLFSTSTPITLQHGARYKIQDKLGTLAYKQMQEWKSR